MSLWTPDGEHEIRKSGGDVGEEPIAPGAPAAETLSPEEQEQAAAMAQELGEARARLLETEVSTVIANHALGIYELAAIHLTADDPALDEAKLAIDALAALVENLAGRLGDGEPTLKEALHQIRMAYVQRSRSMSATEGETSPE